MKKELSLEAMRRRYENILSAAGEGILGLDQNYLHNFVNPAAARMLGYHETELIGIPSHQSWHAYKADGVPYSLKECRICNAMLGGEAVEKYRDRFMRKDGTFFPVEINVAPIFENGVVQGAVIVFQDISARLADEARMKRLSSIIEQTSGAVMVVALDGVIEYVNHAYEEISGYTIAEMLGRHPKNLFFTDENVVEREALWQAFAQGRNWRGILASRRKDGQVVYEDTIGFPLFDDQGTIINYAVIKHDVTATHKLQGQLLQAQKMEAIGTLASGVAHDFNNILTVIIGVSETLITECAEDSELRSDLVDINEAGQRAAALTRQLLAFSRHQMIIPRELCLRKLIVNLMKMMQRLLGEDIGLKFDLPGPETEFRVKADAGQFEQVIINLLVNARDALHDEVGTSPKEISLRLAEIMLDDSFVALHEGSRAGAYALIEIKDSGCGMSPEVLKHCFEPFYTSKELGQGTGLGLSTVYGIVKQNNGYINLYSEPGQGTIIQIYWPLVREKGGVSESEFETVEVDVAQFKGATILLVEDDENIRAVGANQLSKAGFKVITAGDGGEALAKIRTVDAAPDLLFTDLVMPVMGGRQLSRHLRESFPGLPVLFSSGYTDKALVEELGEGEDFLQKPFTVSVLLAKVAGLLEGRFKV